MIVSGGVAWMSEPSRPAGTTSTPRSSASSALPARARRSPRPAQPARSKRSPIADDVVEQRRHLVEHDERRCARERVADVRVRVDVRVAELPERLEAVAHEERSRERQPAAERLADADDVGDVGAGPELADAAEARVDRVDDEERAGLVAAAAQRLEEAVGRDARARAPLHRLDDHARRVARQTARVLAVRCAGARAREAIARHGARNSLEPRRREREQAGAVVRAVEGDDARPPGREVRGAQRDLDRVLAGDAELRRPRQRGAEPHRHLRVGEVAERVHDLLRAPRLEDARVAVAERRDAEAAGEVEQLAPVRRA